MGGLISFLLKVALVLGVIYVIGKILIIICEILLKFLNGILRLLGDHPDDSHDYETLDRIGEYFKSNDEDDEEFYRDLRNSEVEKLKSYIDYGRESMLTWEEEKKYREAISEKIRNNEYVEENVMKWYNGD